MIRRWFGVLRSLIVYWRPGRQSGLRRLYAQFLQPGDLAFDVGAHVGDRTAAFHALGARVVALEPQPALADVLERLVGGRPGVEVVRSAAGPEAGTATLAVSEANPTVSTLAQGWRSRIGSANPSFSQVRWESEVTVPVTTLDALIAEFGVPRFCKIDVEGFEAEVLLGLSHPIPGLSVEFVAGTLDVTQACMDRLAELGTYRYNAIHGEGRAFLFEKWQSAKAMARWLQEGAGGSSSGDLYARLVPTDQGGESGLEDSIREDGR